MGTRLGLKPVQRPVSRDDESIKKAQSEGATDGVAIAKKTGLQVTSSPASHPTYSERPFHRSFCSGALSTRFWILLTVSLLKIRGIISVILAANS